MKVSGITRDDALRAAHLANFLKSGRWDMDGELAASYTKVVGWVHQLCVEIASQLPKAGEAPEKVQAPKVKSITQAPAAPGGSKSSNKKPSKGK